MFTTYKKEEAHFDHMFQDRHFVFSGEGVVPKSAHEMAPPGVQGATGAGARRRRSIRSEIGSGSTFQTLLTARIINRFPPTATPPSSPLGHALRRQEPAGPTPDGLAVLGPTVFGGADHRLRARGGVCDVVVVRGGGGGREGDDVDEGRLLHRIGLE